MNHKKDPRPLITFSSLHIEVLGPRELGKSRLANRYIAEFLAAVERDARTLLRERGKGSRSCLKRFRLQFG